MIKKLEKIKFAKMALRQSLIVVPFIFMLLPLPTISRLVPKVLNHEPHKIMAKRTMRMGFAKYIKNIGKNG